MSARTEAIDAVRPLCKRLGDRIAKMSGGVFDADDAASDMMIGAIDCYDAIDKATFGDEAKVASAGANAVHRDYQDMVRKSTSVSQDESLSVTGNLNRQARASLRVTEDASDVAATPIDVPLQVDMAAMLASMDGLDEEICLRLMDGDTKAAIGRDLKLTESAMITRIASIQRRLSPLNDNQEEKGSV